jgi:hypothetical protein
LNQRVTHFHNARFSHAEPKSIPKQLMTTFPGSSILVNEIGDIRDKLTF